MSFPEESIEQLKTQVNELSQKLQSLAQEKGQKLSEKTDGILDHLKKELELSQHEKTALSAR